MAAKNIVSFEEKLAKLTKADEDRYNETHSRYTLNQFQSEIDKIAPSLKISWRKLLETILEPAGIHDITDNEEIIVQNIDYLKNVLSLVVEEEQKGLHVLANYIVWRFVSGALDYTNKAMQRISSDFWNATTGVAQEPSKEEQCATTVESAFGIAVSLKYLETEFEDSWKNELNEMVENLKTAFDEIITETNWMKEATKAKVLEKKNETAVLMAYPDWIKDKNKVEEYYEGLKLGDSYLENILSVTVWAAVKVLKSFRAAPTRKEWIVPPLTANSYNVLGKNVLLFPAAYLKPPNYSGNRPKHQNYGAIGYIMGHELIHSYDRQGAQYDKHGNLENWWDSDTKTEYDRRGQCLIDQYSKYCHTFPNGRVQCINGRLTEGENIADNEGLRHSFRAYQNYITKNGTERKLPGLESFSAEQLFFISFGITQCESITPAGLMGRFLSDPHSPAEWRVNGVVRNSREFAKAFNCPVDSGGMNIPEEEKCTLW